MVSKSDHLFLNARINPFCLFQEDNPLVEGEQENVTTKLKRYYKNNLLLDMDQTLHKKWSFLLRISSVNVTKSLGILVKLLGNCGFGHIYWKNPY